MVFSVNKRFHLFLCEAGPLNQYNTISRSTRKQAFQVANLFWEPPTSLSPFSVAETEHTRETNPHCKCGAGKWVQRGGAGAFCLWVFSDLVCASLWVHLRMCLFSLYYTGCLQPSCVVCPQLHSHLNLVGSLPWARGYPLPDPPQSPPHIHTQPDTPTLVSLTDCQVCSVCVCLCVSGVE